MRTLYINCNSGVSGDMMLGAFLNLGVPENYLKDKLKRLKLNEFSLEIREKDVEGRQATDVDVVLDRPENLRKNPYWGNYRTYGDILEILNRSSLSTNEKVLSRRIFDIKANAEAKVHGVCPEDVKFHEAGAVDSIVDIIGTAICCEYMNADTVVSNHVPTGASIIAGITDEFGWKDIDKKIIGRGYGTGKRKTGLPPLELILCEE